MTFDFMWLPIHENSIGLQVYSLVTVTVYCMNFVTFLCVTHSPSNYFLFIFVPLLASNPGDATARTRTEIVLVQNSYQCERSLTDGRTASYSCIRQSLGPNTEEH